MDGSTSPRYGYGVVNSRNDLTIGLFPPARAGAVEWKTSAEPVPYEAAAAAMAARVQAITEGLAPELVWLLEHPPLYTAGTSTRPGELLDPRFPVHRTG